MRTAARTESNQRRPGRRFLSRVTPRSVVIGTSMTVVLGLVSVSPTYAAGHAAHAKHAKHAIRHSGHKTVHKTATSTRLTAAQQAAIRRLVKQVRAEAAQHPAAMTQTRASHAVIGSPVFLGPVFFGGSGAGFLVGDGTPEHPNAGLLDRQRLPRRPRAERRQRRAAVR
jgi:hypothetical protein